MPLRQRLARLARTAALPLTLLLPAGAGGNPLLSLDSPALAPAPASHPLGVLPGEAGATATRLEPRPAPASLSAAADWSYESNVASAHLGISAATAGDVNGDGFSDVVALGQNGSTFLYLFLGSPSGPVLAPGYPATLPSSDLGRSVCAAGDVNDDGYGDVAVGLEGVGGGRFRVYLGSATGLDLVNYFEVVSNVTPYAELVRPAGDVNGDGYDDLLVGSPNTSPSIVVCGGSGANGSFELFFGSAAGITATGSEVAYGCQWSSGGFGKVLAGAGDLNADGYADVVVGASSSPGIGSVWALMGSPTGLPTYVSTPNLILLSAGVRLDAYNFGSGFGNACFPAGDLNGDGYADLLVGAPTEDTYGTDAGLAWIFSGGPAGPDTTQKLWFEAGLPNSQFGLGAESAGDYNGDGRPDQLVAMNGSINVVTGIAGGAYISQTLAYDPASVKYCTAGDVNGDGLSDVLIGDSGYGNGQALEGRLLIHYGKADPPSTGWAWETTTALDDPGYGWCVTSVGDVNGDGFDDVAVGAPFWDDFSGGTDNGLVEVYYGSATGASPAANWYYFGASGDRAGISVAAAGDINSDGYADFVVGADQATTGNGLALVWYGGPSGPAASPDRTLAGFSFDSRFGACVAGAGDVNGDGYGDVLVGAPMDEDPSVLPAPMTDEGIARLYLGGPSGLAASPAWSDRGEQDNAHHGTSLASIGDANGDGASDIAIGAPDYDVPSGPFFLLDSGRLRVFNGKYTGTPLTLQLTINGPTNGRLGVSVAGAGDVNGDGYSDLIAGAPSWGTGQGWVGVYPGSSSGISGSTIWTLAGGETSSALGSSVAGAGDVNLDGLSDVLVGSENRDGGGPQDRGFAALYLGPLPLGGPSAWSLNGPSSFANLGHSVASAGDVDGDSRNDLIVGMPGYTSAVNRQGLARIYLGAGGSGLRRASLALKPSNGHIVQPVGLTDAGTVMIGQTGRSAAGRVRVRAEYRMVPPPGLNTPERSGLSATVMTGAPGTNGSVAGVVALETGLAGGVPYAWQVRTRARSPYFPTSAWFSPARSGATEWDLRGPGSWLAVEPPAAAAALDLAQVAPNPTPGAATVSFTLSRTGPARLDVLDLQGRRVRSLFHGTGEAGPHRMVWDGRDEAGQSASAGLYFVRLEAEGRVRTRKFTILR